MNRRLSPSEAKSNPLSLERLLRYSPDQPRDPNGEFGSGGEPSGNENPNNSPKFNINSKIPTMSSADIVGQRPKVFYQTTAQSGSSYADFDLGGDWFHVRIATHPNTTQDSSQAAQNKTIRDSIRKSSSSGMKEPHELTIITKSIPETNEEKIDLAKKVIAKNKDVFTRELIRDFYTKEPKGIFGQELTTNKSGKPIED